MTNKFDFEKSFNTILGPLRLIGFWRTNPKSKPNMVLFVASVVFINMIIVPELIKVYLVRNDTRVFTLAVPPLMTGIFDDVKLFYFVRNSSRITRLLERTRKRSFQPKNAVQEENLKGMFGKLNIMYLLYRVCAVICLGAFSMSPFTEGLGQRRLPFLAWYPYDFTETRWYLLTFVHQVLAQGLGADIHISVDLLNFMLMAVIVAEFDMLGDTLRTLFREEGFEMDDLRTCIDHHKEIIEFSQEVYEMLSFGVFAQLMLTIICLCQLLFQLSILNIGMQFVAIFCYAYAALFQLFLYCWWGTEISSKSQDLPSALFESDWVNTPTHFKKNLQLFIRRTQTPMVMCAADFFKVNLQTFMGILRLSYSYFTVIRQTNST